MNHLGLAHPRESQKAALEGTLMELHQLACTVGEFSTAINSFRLMAQKPAKFRSAKVSLEFDGRFASLVCPGHAVSFNAAGLWPGRATFSANLIIALIRSPPTGEHLEISTDTKRITVGSTSMACTWQKAIIEDGDSYFSLPEPIDHLHMLQMLERYGRDSLYQQGFQRMIRNAKAWRIKRITTALESLAEFGVTFDDLAHLVSESIKRGTQEGQRDAN